MIAQFIEWAGQSKIGEQPPTLDQFTANAVKPIQWPVAGDFVASSAKFADGLLIAGDVTPTAANAQSPTPVAASA